MKAIPLRYVALIKPDQVNSVTSGGIWIPQHTRERDQVAIDRGELIAHGDGFWMGQEGRKPQVGETVLFDRYAGVLIKIDDQEYRLCNDEKIIAILEE